MNYEAIRGPLLGVEVGFNEAQGLAREVQWLASIILSLLKAVCVG